ncbi:MAG: DMT family transporter [Pseudomonadota bacterium]
MRNAPSFSTKALHYILMPFSVLSPTSKGYLAGLTAIVLWSVNVIIARIYAGHMGAAEITMWRWLVAVCILVPFAMKPVRAAWPIMKARPVFYLSLLVGLGIFRIVLLNSLVYLAGETASAIDMALMGTTGPLFLALLGSIFLKKSISLRQILGYGITISGVVLLILHGDLTNLQDFHFVAGDAWMLVSALCFAIYSIILEFKPKDFSATALLTLSAIIGLALVTPLGIQDILDRGTLPPTSTLLVMVYLGIFPSVVAFYCWLAALKYLGPVRSGLIYYMLPLLSSLEAVAFLGESFAVSQAFGAVLILGGVMFASHARHTKTHAVHGVHSL